VVSGWVGFRMVEDWVGFVLGRVGEVEGRLEGGRVE
jgi:hypothetical protein